MFDLSVGQWTIVHGPVIVSYTLNVVWYKNMIAGDNKAEWSDFLAQKK